MCYTTFCDWMHAKTYPRIEVLEESSYYFRIETTDFCHGITGSETPADTYFFDEEISTGILGNFRVRLSELDIPEV